ncbi:MAG: aminotransferase class I/II-fold pyridoxal phosphate-dependent enzyme [Proteobacteria bacterium]|nr:aminotransferase class I/II-fold pyridoxal phosphate-dependent enzyme [Pseudomonadota bacterium]
MTDSKTHLEINPLQIDTIIQHAGQQHRIGRGLVGACETSVTYRTPTAEDAPIYSRLGNTSNHHEVEDLLATLHGAEAAIATGSGMSATNLIFMSLAKPGDHILCLDICYGGTYHYLTKILNKWGVETTFAPITDWNRLKQANTKFVFFESITNPFCVPQDIAKAVEFSRQNQFISICDNTFASPILCQPLAMGVDLVLESATKYLNGHSDVIAGAVFGAGALLDQLRQCHAYLGTFLPPAQCVQLMRGIRTLPLRMDAHGRNAQQFAEHLQGHDSVEEVYYGSPGNEVIKAQFSKGFGGMVTVRFKSTVPMQNFLAGLKLTSDVPSLGGTETTATRPMYTTNWFMNDDQKTKLGITPYLVRFSVGLEDPRDILADIEQSLVISRN